MRIILLFILFFNLLTINIFSQESNSSKNEFKIIEYKIEKVYYTIVSKKYFSQFFSNPNMVYQNTRFGPNIEKEKINGYKIYSIDSNTFLYKLGVRSRDIILQISGVPLKDSEKVIEVLESLKTSEYIPVIIQRKGKHYKIIIEVIDFENL